MIKFSKISRRRAQDAKRSAKAKFKIRAAVRVKRNAKVEIQICAALILVATIRSIRLELAKFSQISRSAERKIFPREPINSVNLRVFKGADHARSRTYIRLGAG